MFLFVFWIINFAVPQIFHTIKSDFPDFKKVENPAALKWALRVQIILGKLRELFIILNSVKFQFFPRHLARENLQSV